MLAITSRRSFAAFASGVLAVGSLVVPPRMAAAQTAPAATSAPAATPAPAAAPAKPAAAPPASPPLSVEEAEKVLRESEEGKLRLQAMEEEKKETQRRKDVLDKHFGAGIFANFDFGKTPRIKSARVVDGVVRIEEESRGQVGFLLEAHRFHLPPTNDGLARGIFVGVVANAQSAIDAVALGYIWGFRQKGTTETLNVGVALSVTPRAQVLGDGIKPDEPLPGGETEIRYKYKTLFGLMLMTSFGF